MDFSFPNYEAEKGVWNPGLPPAFNMSHLLYGHVQWSYGIRMSILDLP